MPIPTFPKPTEYGITKVADLRNLAGEGWNHNVWEDKWLHASYMPKPKSLKLAECGITKVADLRTCGRMVDQVAVGIIVQ